MTIDIHRVLPDEGRRAANVLADALLSTRMTDDEWETRGSSWHESDGLAAWDAGRCVGHAGAHRLNTTVPGGARLKTAGVTRVGVLPTHTRRGLLTTMMSQLLSELRQDGTVLASLRASEAVIYQRFGFAIAAEAAAVRLTSRSMLPLRSSVTGTMRILAEDEISSVVPALYDRCARHRVGTVARPDMFWKRILSDAVTVAKPSFVAVHTNVDGVDDGYVSYTLRWVEQPDLDELGAGSVHDLYGADADAERALWAFLLGIDLVVEWTAEGRPIDEAIRFAVRDPRAYKLFGRWDEQWLRLLDVDAALESRSYGPASSAVVIDVNDPMFPVNDGRRRISATGAERCDDEPDLAVGIGALSAAYLGGTSWRELVDAGQVTVRRDDAVAEADALFAHRPHPFCGTFF